jgi:hypothetical protein
MNVNKYYDLYNNLEENDFEDFENKFLNIDKNVCLKLCVFDDSKIIELSIDPKEKNDIAFNLKLACLFQNAILTRNMNLIKYINNKYDAINRWKSLPQRYITTCFDPVYAAIERGFIDVLKFLSDNNAIEEKYFEDDIFTVKLIQIACLVNFGYTTDQIIEFLETIFKIKEDTIINGDKRLYNFENIKQMIIEEINLQIDINSRPD